MSGISKQCADFDPVAHKCIGTAEVRQVDHENSTGAFPPGTAQKACASPRSAPGGDKVVDKQDISTFGNDSRIAFQPGRTVFERVIFANCRDRQFPGFAQRDETGVQSHRQRSAKDEAARFDTGDGGEALAFYEPGKRIDRRCEPRPVGEQGGDIAKLDSG